MATRTVDARDPFGNPITLQHAASAAAGGDFIEGFLHYEPRSLAVSARGVSSWALSSSTLRRRAPTSSASAGWA